MLRETLPSGAIRIRDEGVAFAFARMRPGVLAVVGAGIDHGSLGDAPVAEIDRELLRFPIPTEVFVDTAEVDVVDLGAQQVWTQWFRDRRGPVARAHILVRSRHLDLAVTIAQHYSGTAGTMRIYRDRFALERALERAARGATLPGPSILTEPAARVVRRPAWPDVMFDDGRCKISCRRHARRTLLVTIEGQDRGTLTSAVFDEIAAARAEMGGLRLFMDLRRAEIPVRAVWELWTAWFAANRASTDCVVLLADKRPLHVVVSIAQWLSHTGNLVRVVDDPAAFRRALEAGPRLPLARGA